MDVQKCPVTGPYGYCQHEDGDGFWPASAVNIDYPTDSVSVMSLAENVAPNLVPPDGEWAWASDTIYVHVGPVTSIEGSVVLRNVVISRAVETPEGAALL